ncbi:MAG: hypothetical protein CMJ48_02055, partial [Planctomycetaceae bacterium]|nr:hypothetical protein [Planctomycetaceae bacterium]
MTRSFLGSPGSLRWLPGAVVAATLALVPFGCAEPSSEPGTVAAETADADAALQNLELKVVSTGTPETPRHVFDLRGLP